MTFFIIFWSFFLIPMIYGYIKMNEEERQEVKDEFTSHQFIFTIGILLGGFFLAMLGNALNIHVIIWIAVSLIVIGGIGTVLDMWKEGMKGRSVFILILMIISVVVFLT